MAKLTIQRLANVCMHSWETEREIGFHMTPEVFKRWIAEMEPKQLKFMLENLGLLFREIREMGMSEIELKAEGHHSLFAPLCKTQTAKAAGVDENIVTPGQEEKKES
jgi:hypothetical protein